MSGIRVGVADTSMFISGASVGIAEADLLVLSFNDDDCSASLMHRCLLSGVSPLNPNSYILIPIPIYPNSYILTPCSPYILHRFNRWIDTGQKTQSERGSGNHQHIGPYQLNRVTVYNSASHFYQSVFLLKHH